MGLRRNMIFPALVLALGGCASPGEQQPLSSTPAPGLPGAPQAAAPNRATAPMINFPALPALPAGRHASLSTETSLDGSEYFSRSEMSMVDGSALVLDASGGPMSWAVWEYPAIAGGGSLQLDIVVEGQGCFVAVADYGQLRWLIYGPFAESPQLGLDQASLSSPGGNSYVAVIAPAGSEVTINWVMLSGERLNEEPLASISASPQSGEAPLEVSFDASASGDSDGVIVTYDYDLDGDGDFELADAGPQVDTTYEQPGIFNARVRVTDNDGASDEDFVQINCSAPGNEPPLASLEAEPESGPAPLEVTLDASGSQDSDGAVASFDFDLDGNGVFEVLDSAAEIQHTFSVPGEYEVSVRVTDDDGSAAVAAQTIQVQNNPPLAELLPETASGAAPFTVEFDASGSSPGPDGGDSLTLFEWDLDGDGEFEQQTGSSGMLEFEYSAAIQATVAVRVWDAYGGSATDTCALSVSGPAVAALALNPDYAACGETVTLDASASTGDQGIVLYEWDLDGDGSFETSTEDNPLAETSFADTGEYLLRVRVTDGSEQSDEAEASLTVAVWGMPQNLNAPGGIGIEPSLLVVEGNPAVAYYEFQQSALCYRRALDAAGSSWGDRLTLATEDNGTGKGPDLQIIDGRPAIAFYQESGLGEGLRYVAAEDTTGEAWAEPVVVETSTQGEMPSLAQIDGRPAISYYQNGHFLGFCIADDAEGESWPEPQNLGSTLFQARTTLLNIEGRAAICYTTDEGHLHYLRAANDAATDWEDSQLLDSSVIAGLHASMLVVGGAPAIAYNFWTPDLSDIRLKYVRALDATGGTWSAPVTVAVGPSTEYSYSWPSLAVVNGNPAIAFSTELSNAQFYVRATDSAGTAWSAPLLINPPGSSVDFISSLLVVDGLPTAAYSAKIDEQFCLAFQRASNADGL